MNLQAISAHIRPRADGADLVTLLLAGVPNPVPGTYGTLTVEFATGAGQAETYLREHLTGVPFTIEPGVAP
jgi:hypothetical protein